MKCFQSTNLCIDVKGSGGSGEKVQNNQEISQIFDGYLLLVPCNYRERDYINIQVKRRGGQVLSVGTPELTLAAIQNITQLQTSENKKQSIKDKLSGKGSGYRSSNKPLFKRMILIGDLSDFSDDSFLNLKTEFSQTEHFAGIRKLIPKLYRANLIWVNRPSSCSTTRHILDSLTFF